MNAIETYRAQKEEINAKLSGFGQDSLKPFFLQLFEAHPDAQVVRWYQYTPHFNDGDPCVFGVGDVETSKIRLSEISDEVKEAYPGDSWEYSQAAQEVNVFFNGIDDVLRQAFGDGVRVYVERNGTITVDEYGHE